MGIIYNGVSYLCQDTHVARGIDTYILLLLHNHANTPENGSLYLIHVKTRPT